MEYKISEINESDLPACVEVYVDTFREPPWNEEWNVDDAFERLNDFFNMPGAIALKATSEGDILGFLFGKMQVWNGEVNFDIDELCVSHRIQRRGVGGSLMVSLEKMLATKGVTGIFLVTHREGAASNFYEKFGFSENANLSIMKKKIC